ncbi:PQQ-binding-like beta-propeller repeat protein [bacterium]|nr:PQQ-binding-like beta-propeller repeat protein [bacterium]MCI0606003.1 PQQ-binding-like beta-propeller repeat protein [bacterium]
MTKRIYLFVFLLFASVLSAENWPHWRGPRRDGTSGETKLPVKWSQTENVVWRLPLPGEAAATPVIWGDRIFVTSASGNELVLLCISKAGKILWQRTAGTGSNTARGDEANLAAPSPTTDGQHVWAFFGSGDLVCFDFDGKQIWKTNLQQRYGKFNLYFVMSSSPLLDGNRLYLQLIHTDASLVLALDKATGKEIWKQQRSSDARDECKHSYASPFLYRDGKDEFLLIHGADYITAHRLNDGGEIWRCGGLNPGDRYNPSLRLVASPVAIPGLIVVPSAKNGPVLGLKPDGKGNITESRQNYHWKMLAGTPDVPSPLIHGGLVYLCRENGDLSVLDAQTGRKLYLEHTHQSRHRASPVYGDGKIYVTSREGTVSVVKAGPAV